MAATPPQIPVVPRILSSPPVGQEVVGLPFLRISGEIDAIEPLQKRPILHRGRLIDHTIINHARSNTEKEASPGGFSGFMCNKCNEINIAFSKKTAK